MYYYRRQDARKTWQRVTIIFFGDRTLAAGGRRDGRRKKTDKTTRRTTATSYYGSTKHCGWLLQVHTEINSPHPMHTICRPPFFPVRVVLLLHLFPSSSSHYCTWTVLCTKQPISRATWHLIRDMTMPDRDQDGRVAGIISIKAWKRLTRQSQ